MQPLIDMQAQAQASGEAGEMENLTNAHTVRIPMLGMAVAVARLVLDTTGERAMAVKSGTDETTVMAKDKHTGVESGDMATDAEKVDMAMDVEKVDMATDAEKVDMVTDAGSLDMAVANTAMPALLEHHLLPSTVHTGTVLKLDGEGMDAAMALDTDVVLRGDAGAVSVDVVGASVDVVGAMVDVVVDSRDMVGKGMTKDMARKDTGIHTPLSIPVCSHSLFAHQSDR